MNRYYPVAFGLFMVVVAGSTFANELRQLAGRPNILLIISEDNGPELGCYGDPFARTPNLDQLAKQGIRFQTAWVTQSVCSPSRGSILTGLYPHQNGQIGLATHQFAMFRDWPTSYSILKQAGYRTGMIGKLHVNPEQTVEKWIDFRAIRKANFAKKNLKDYSQKSAEFFAASEEPFFLTVNFPDAHWPVQNRVQNRPQKLIAEQDVRPMGYVHFDNSRLRKHVQGYYNCLSRLDECIGELMSALEKSGRAENTLVIYLGDHGGQFARGKVHCFEGGLRIPMMVRWPKVVPAGRVSTEMVSTIDLLPTIVEVARAKSPKNLPGVSLVGHLKGNGQSLREYLFAERNTDAAILHYPQRAIRDSRYKLIKTLMPGQEDPGAQKYLVNGASNFRGSPTFDELKTANSTTQRIYREYLKPPEYQLFDLQEDPFELNNLADHPAMQKIKSRLSTQLRLWQKETRDMLDDPSRLNQLTEEVEYCLKHNVRVPKGGWKYLDYLNPHRSRESKPQAAKN